MSFLYTVGKTAYPLVSVRYTTENNVVNNTSKPPFVFKLVLGQKNLYQTNHTYLLTFLLLATHGTAILPWALRARQCQRFRWDHLSDPEVVLAIQYCSFLPNQ